ncbi:stage II sporulation protein P [Microaerobacter geothermalis]|uniref:stage II sporulation protein P n=1 Tax=Microaerobacter geothermalis TaxID=674972 RepID=UPI001F31336D|nr:stage II sporulation protein P [Microaerobacter geothermalis]MCF6092870.1 stage II sporulation protein P [Microaerobacter geothermalis]
MEITLTQFQRIFVTLIVAILLVILLLGTYMLKGNSPAGGVYLTKMANFFSKDAYLSLLAEEIPYFSELDKFKNRDPSPVRLSSFLFQLATSINPEDPRSLMGREIPRFALYSGQILVAGVGVDYTDLPMESPPPPEALAADSGDIPPVSAQEETKVQSASVRNPNGKKVVFIYQTHNRESWTKYVSSGSSPFDPKINVTLLGKRLSQELNKKGIGTIVSTKDFAKEAEAYSLSYAVSLKTVKEVLSQNRDITYVFDIHRDDADRDRTTTTIDGNKYARLFFVLGKGNKNWQANYQFAKELHDRLEEKYPSISKGIVAFEKSDYRNGEYNQSVSPNAITVEIGGVGNTLEESYRTVEALADVVAEMYWDASPVSGQEEGVR